MYWVGVTYLWSGFFLICFLYYYRTDIQEAPTRKAGIILAFATGWLSAQGTEGIAAVLIPALALWLVWRVWKGLPVSRSAWAGALGALTGFFLLVGSPAMTNRAGCASYLDGWDPEAVTAFVQNLDWGKVKLLEGGGTFASLTKVPLVQHVYFLPYWADMFFSAGCVVLLLTAGLVLMQFVWRGRAAVRLLPVPGVLVVAGVVSGVSYVTGALPNEWTYYPSGCVFMAACAYLYLRTPLAAVRYGLPVLLLASALHIYIPPTLEAYRYKRYESVRMDCIRSQAAAGVQDIHVPYPCPEPPQDKFNLMKVDSICEDPEAWSGKCAAKYFRHWFPQVETVRQAPYGQARDAPGRR